MFNQRKLVVATKHHKEKVITPLFEGAFGVKCFASENFDTDLPGIFTGEIECKDDPITTLRNKCLRAMEASDCDLGIACTCSPKSDPLLLCHQDTSYA